MRGEGNRRVGGLEGNTRVGGQLTAESNKHLTAFSLNP